MAKEAILKVENLRKSFGRKEVLKGINFEIAEREILGVIGMSGSGKSVLLKTIINFWKPTAGKVTYKDAKVNRLAFRKHFGFSTQESCFYPEMSVEENLIHFGKLYGLKSKMIKPRISELLNMLELEDCARQMASELSGGMQKRLDIACSLIHKPKLLFLDEPTVELDPILRREVMRLINKINEEEGVTILMASHLLGGVEAMCDNIAILHDGKIIEYGNPTKIRELYGKNEEIHLKLVSGNYKKIAKHLESRKNLGINKILVGNMITVYCKDAEKVLDYLLNQLERMNEKIVDLHVSKPSLTEVFETLIGKCRKEAKEAKAKQEEKIKVKEITKGKRK
jgi:ABC-2 type transport system ATP-binding protein